MIDEVYLLPDDERPRKITRIGNSSSQATHKSLAERFRSMQRDCLLNHFHLMVIVNDKSDAASQKFVDKHLLNYTDHKTVASFMQFRVEPSELADQVNRDFLAGKDWPTVPAEQVFLCAYDAHGKELGRVVLDTSASESTKLAYDFIEAHAPAQQDALDKWDEAFRTATEEDKLVWMRTGQRYCGPCFRLSRWIDDHRTVLEKDFVLLKIDNVRDLNGNEVAQRMIQGRFVGVPFHAIFGRDERLITDSYGPIGNVGYMTGIEGKRHLRAMLEAACTKISSTEIEALVQSLED